VYEVTMPKLSDTMETGKIIEWKVKEGDAVHEGDVLAEVESDKAVMELECFRDGAIAKIVRGGGEEVPVGQTIALIATKAPSPEKAAAPPPSAPPAKAAPARERPARPRREETVEEEVPPRPSPPSRPVEGRRVAASPYARKLAAERGVDYSTVKGSGPGGRVVAADIQRLGRPAAEPVAPTVEDELPRLEVTPEEAEVADAPFRLKTQAKNVLASQRAVPHFYVTMAADVTALLRLKDELKGAVGATVTHLVMYACLRALREHPEVNRSYDRGRLFQWKRVNLGLAVDTEQGLTVAVLQDAQGLSLKKLVERTIGLVERARAGKLSPDERRHATFTITNLGMFDVEHFQPIVNPPSSITLAVSSAVQTPLVRDNAIHIGTVMKLTAACDHRAIDGATAARFLKDLKGLLEDPRKMEFGA
jgi:pyruvate dehydrogenase E2 component (dihydrolipoamide acetyltransferase)